MTPSPEWRCRRQPNVKACKPRSGLEIASKQGSSAPCQTCNVRDVKISDSPLVESPLGVALIDTGLKSGLMMRRSQRVALV
jgi:hypothetical protein